MASTHADLNVTKHLRKPDVKIADGTHTNETERVTYLGGNITQKAYPQAEIKKRMGIATATAKSRCLLKKLGLSPEATSSRSSASRRRGRGRAEDHKAESRSDVDRLPFPACKPKFPFGVFQLVYNIFQVVAQSAGRLSRFRFCFVYLSFVLFQFRLTLCIRFAFIIGFVVGIISSY